jgi:alkylation response protein AidB-like acyl-CoA dehydrogenase
MHDSQSTDPVQAARSLFALIDSEADAAQEATTLTTAVVEALTDANLYQLMIPTELGGGNADAWTTVETIEEISRADPSAGWAYMANAVAGGIFVTRVGEAAAKNVFGSKPPGILAGMVAPSGTATPVAGGYMIEGTIGFASGSGHATWITGGAMIENERGRDLMAYLIPKDKTECLYNWNVEGLVATGSYDYAVHNQFVPSEYTFLNEDTTADTAPADRRCQAGLYLDRFALAISGHVGVAFGTAGRAMEEITIIADQGKKRRNAPPIAEQQLFQHDFVVADAKLRAARAYAKEAIIDATNALATRSGTPQEAHRIYQACSWGVQAAVDAVEFAYYWSGSQGLRKPHPLGRIFRDMVMAQNIHAFVDTTVFTSAFPSAMASYRTE